MTNNSNYTDIVNKILLLDNDDNAKAREYYQEVIMNDMLSAEDVNKMQTYLISRNIIDKNSITKNVNINEFILSYFDKYNIIVKANGDITFTTNNTTNVETKDNFSYFIEKSSERIKNNEDNLITEIHADSIQSKLNLTKQQIQSVFYNEVNKRSKLALHEEVGWIFLNEEQDIKKRYEYFYELADIISVDNTEIHALILMKLFGQIKTKLLHGSSKVDSHIMPIFHGKQGAGKSQFVLNIMNGLGSFTSPASFKDIDDKRGYSKYINSAVLIFDEMERASSTDINTVKGFVTSNTIPVRPMGTNKIVNLENNLTLIGTTNELIEDIFRDPTGNRRFIQFNYGSKDYEHPYKDPRFANIDFKMLWNMCIDTDDKIFSIMNKEEMLKDFISQHSYKDPVQRFLYDDTALLNIKNVPKSSGCYYDLFRSWCESEGITTIMNKNSFCKKAKIYILNDTDRFNNKILNGKQMYIYI